MTTSCFSLCRRSAFIWTGLALWLLYAILSLCPLVAPLTPCRRMRYHSSCAMSLPLRVRLDLRRVPFEPMTSEGSPPLSRFTVTGPSPQFWSPPLGAPVRCSLHFIFATFNTNTMAFALWVYLWLRVRGSSSPHLFLPCSGGGGGTTSPLFYCFYCEFTFCFFCFFFLFVLLRVPA